MTENIIFKAVENIVPLLLAVVIVIVTVYFIVTKIFNIPTQLGKGIARKVKGTLDSIEQAKWGRLERKVTELQSENNNLNDKYTILTKNLPKIKKELEDLSSEFEKFDRPTTIKDVFSHPSAIKDIFSNPKKFSDQKQYIWDKIKELSVSIDDLTKKI